jgi:hypothetical protein
MASIYHNLRSERKIKAATGLNSREFATLLSHFREHYRPKQKNPHTDFRAPVLTDPGEALFLFLHYYKAYPTLENMALYFDIDVRTVCNYLEYIKAPLLASLRELGCMAMGPFRDQSKFDEAFAGVEDLVVDCTEIPVQRPSDNDFQGFVYSGKKKAHTIKVLVVATLLGQILYSGLWWNGRSADVTVFRQELGKFDMGGRRLHMDLGFYGTEGEIINGLAIIPPKKEKKKELGTEDKKIRKLYSKLRVIVENTLAGVKSFFINRTRQRFHLQKKSFEAFHISCGLYNLKRKSLNI